MLLNDQAHVLPKDPVVPTHSDIRGVPQPTVSLYDFLGTLFFLSAVAVVALQLIAAVMVLSPHEAMLVFLKIEAVSLFVSFIIHRFEKIYKARAYTRKVDHALKALEARGIESSISEALALTMRVRRAATSFQESLDTLHSLFGQAERHLQKATQAYQSGAYVPFWDNLVLTTMALAKFNAAATQMRNLAHEINEALTNRIHNFPGLASSLLEMPEPKSVVDGLVRLVRLGQTNVEFARIWAQLRTRETLIDGSTLDEVVDDLGQVLHLALSNLKSELSPPKAEGVSPEQPVAQRRFEEESRRWTNIQETAASA